MDRLDGRVVNVSSGAATGSGIRDAGAYSVSKAGLDMLTRTVATEIAGSGVTINAVYPGVVDTAMQTHLRETPAEQFERFRSYYERGELLDPDAPGRLTAAIVLSDMQGEVISIREERAQALLRTESGGV